MNLWKVSRQFRASSLDIADDIVFTNLVVIYFVYDIYNMASMKYRCLHTYPNIIREIKFLNYKTQMEYQHSSNTVYK